MVGPVYEENLALIQTIVGENSRAISILSQLLQTPYWGGFYTPVPITPALLRLDPMFDPLLGTIPVSKNFAKISSTNASQFSRLRT